MSRIIQLDQQTANSIAAGEVVERPSSVVKELIENALDAGASVVTTEITQGGIQSIFVTDNGCGMDESDALLAFGRHATSKLKEIDDLATLMTMGFRGEALASIAAVSRVTLETRESGSTQGTRVIIEGGALLEQQPIGCSEGTRIRVENLFYNVPARFKFLRKDSTEAGYVADVVEKMALARPDVSFRLISNQQELLHTPGNNDLHSTLYAVLGKQTAQGCLPVETTEGPVSVSGLIGRPDITRGNRGQQCVFVNGRLIRSRIITAALDEAYKTRLMKGRYAIAVLFLSIPTRLVDVNVHPQKLEVRFWNDSEVFRCVYHAVQSALQAGSGIAPELEKPDKEPIKEENTTIEVSQAKEAIQTEEDEENKSAEEKQKVQALQQLTLPLRDAEKPGEEIYFASKEESMPEQLMTIDQLSQARLMGTLFDTYVLMEAKNELLLIDQHAAHEKILFERLVERHRQIQKDGSELIQPLLVPVVVEISRKEMQIIKDETDRLQQLGFEYSLMGENSIAIRSIPDTGDRTLQPEQALRAALEALQQDQADDGIEEVFYQMACKAAVKAHDRLNEIEIKQLLSDLAKLNNPYQCPHGRPVIIRVSRSDIEKRFKRKG